MNHQIITPLAKVAGVNKEEFFALIKGQNKAKSWSVSPIRIEFENGQISHNAQQVKGIVENIKNWAKDELEKANLQTLKDDEAVLREIHTWLRGSRTQLTKPLDELKKEFTTIEKELSEVVQSFKQKQDELQLFVFKQRQEILESAILEEQKFVKEKYDIDIDLLSLMQDWVMRKRKTQMKKAVSSQITEFAEKIIKPILEERELRERKEQQMQSLNLDFGDIDCQNRPEEAISTLERLLEQVEVKYPDIVDTAKMNIQANISIAQNALEKQEREAREQEVQDREEIIADRVEAIYATATKEKNIEELENLLAELRKLRAEAETKDTLSLIEGRGVIIKEKINRLNKACVVKEATTTQAEDTEQTVRKNRTVWSIDLSDLEVLATMTVEADTEKEAKKAFLEQFKGLLDFIELQEIEQ